MSKRSKQRQKLGRPRNTPTQQTQVLPQQSIYGSVVPFTTINGKKHVTPKPNSLAIRNFARNNAVVRRCINVIKDAIAKKKLEIIDVDGNNNAELKAIFGNLFANPNDEDTHRTFVSAVVEDLVEGDCGCIEIGRSGNPQRPMFLWTVDGFSMEFVLGANDGIKFAQKQSMGYGVGLQTAPMNYKYFTGDQILYLKKQVFTSSPYGLSPVESAWDYIRALTNTFNYSAEIASNALPKYMANIKGIQGEMLNAYRSYFSIECMGTANLPLVSAEDVKAVQIAPISEEATFKAYQEFVIGIIAITFGIPPEKLSVAKSNDRSKISEINENLLQDCIIPYCNVVEEAYNRIISMTGFGDKVKAQFVHEETLEQLATKQKMVVELFQNDLATANGALKMLGLPPLDDEYADDRITLGKAKINEKYAVQSGGYNGSGDIKANHTGDPPNGGD
jgi:HK97 family phage portal protein